MKVPNHYPIYRDKIKAILRAQNLTYSDLGKRIGLSESGVKKILSAKDVSLSRLTQICEATGTSLADLALNAPEPKTPDFEFDQETQEYFLKNRDCFHLFFLILTESKTFDDIIKEHRISKKIGIRYLQELDKRKLIKWMPNDKVISLVKPSAFFKYSGPFIKQLVKEWTYDLVEESLNKLNKNTKKPQNEIHTLRLFYLLPETKKEFVESLKRLLEEFDMKAIREQKYYGKQTKPFRLLTISAEGHYIK